MRAGSKSAGVVLSIAAVGYLLAVSQRSTLGAASIVAIEKFSISGEQLALLAVAQLGVYALMQIPVGVLLDRYGPRVLLAVGGFVMGMGQLLVAYASSFEAAAVGRLAVGFGDAFTFISMIRLINGWFEGSRATKLQQWMGNIGQLGQVVSAFPFALLLHISGWQAAFVTWAALSLVTAALVWMLVGDDRVPHPHDHPRISLRQAWRQLGVNLRSPAVRMAFWTHFTIQSPGTVMVLLWGLPFLVKAQGLAKPVASGLLSMFVFVGICFGVIYGQICAKRPEWRRHLVFILFALTIAAWSVVLSFSGQAPFAVLFALFFVLGISGPGSMLAFDFSKSSVPKSRLGSANGFINIGGFLASFSMMYLIGLALDWQHRLHPTGSLYQISGFRVALLSQFFVLGIGISMFWIESRKAARESFPVE